jgi:hypothetical protein
MRAFLIGPAFRPRPSQSARYTSQGMPLLLAHSSASVSAPIAPPAITNVKPRSAWSRSSAMSDSPCPWFAPSRVPLVVTSTLAWGTIQDHGQEVDTFAEEWAGDVTGWDWGVALLEYLAYAAFFVVVFACLYYVMDALESEGAPKDPKQ